MGKRVLFIVVDTAKGKINETTKSTISENLGKEDAQVFMNIENDGREMYHTLKVEINKIVNDVNNFDYVCLVPNGASVNVEAKKIFDEYQVDREDEVKEVYLPLVVYTVDGKPVMLNKHVWNSMIAYEAGVLDLDLALKQIDSTLFGAFVPTALFFNPEYYHETVKYYQQYHLLNNLSDGDNLILGIPKVLLTMGKEEFDFAISEVPNEEKIENFNLAREKWTKKPVQETTELTTAKV